MPAVTILPAFLRDCVGAQAELRGRFTRGIHTCQVQGDFSVPWSKLVEPVADVDPGGRCLCWTSVPIFDDRVKPQALLIVKPIQPLDR